MWRDIDYKTVEKLFESNDFFSVAYLKLGSKRNDIFLVKVCNESFLNRPYLSPDGKPRNIEYSIATGLKESSPVFEDLEKCDRRYQRINKWVSDRLIFNIKDEQHIPSAIITREKAIDMLSK